ncbi:hypothetical protein FRX31_016327 [Thalictrum thalictroides]|uniref:PA domain-containing protein n=1 Tax=Thalictrum thalictroides TaxID=46969 RepID=A0A7J6WAV2_THATH|nr:hypothetical protein FRX31_016327 [Thalictrum thalictroides]
MEKGIFVSCAVGNSGSKSYTMKNGKSLYPEDLLISRVSLYYGHDNTSKNCKKNSLNSNDVSKKIVFCALNNKTDVYDQATEVYRAGAIGAISVTDSAKPLFLNVFQIPFVGISPTDGETVEEYLKKNIRSNSRYQVPSYGIGSKTSTRSEARYISCLGS